MCNAAELARTQGRLLVGGREQETRHLRTLDLVDLELALDGLCEHALRRCFSALAQRIRRVVAAVAPPRRRNQHRHHERDVFGGRRSEREDRKSTRLNSSHLGISYAVFCLKKKKKKQKRQSQYTD